MSIDLFVYRLECVPHARGEFVERARELSTGRLLDDDDITQLEAEFPDRTEAIAFLRESLEFQNGDDDMLRVTFG